MKISSRITKFKVSWMVAVLCMGYLYISSPGEVVVEENANVIGLFNKARESIQGKRFWKNQLIEVENELEWELGEPKRIAEFDREMRKDDREFQKEEEQFYQEYPDMRPSAAELKAEALRVRADAIEQAELDRELNQYRLQRIGELRIIKNVLEKRSK